ncbi:MAG: GNAT family N-acetyltransferase [Egibacteraceae bacterium]
MARIGVDYTIRRYEPADEPYVLTLLEQTLASGPTRSADFFRWKHARNPFGRSMAWIAEAEGRIVGVRIFQRWRFLVDGRPVEAVRAVDTATHPDHQRRGIFTRLTRTALEVIRGDVDLVFNTPNAQSLPGYLEMGWSRVGAVPIAVRLCRPLRFLRGLRQATRDAPARPPPPCALPTVSAILADSDGVGALLAAATPAKGRLRTDRSVAYLRWRYGEAPGLDYRALALHHGTELVGLAVGRPRWRGRLAEFTLSDVLVRHGDRQTARRLLRATAHTGVDHVTAHLASGTEPAILAKGCGFIAIPGRGMTLVANPLTTLRPDPLRLASWCCSLGDLEVF